MLRSLAEEVEGAISTRLSTACGTSQCFKSKLLEFECFFLFFQSVSFWTLLICNGGEQVAAIQQCFSLEGDATSNFFYISITGFWLWYADARFLYRRMVTKCVLEMKSFSSHCLLLVWLLCCCLQCDSARIIGDGKSLRNTGDQFKNDVLQCNNTIQGRYLLSDSRGYVCSNMEVSPATACCPEGGEQYSCQGCNMVTQCCDSYEYCVSCCLNPMRTALEVALKTKLARQATAGLCTSLFDYCSGRCRHNSESVVHENAYVSGEHHCFATQSVSHGDPVDTGATTELGDLSILIGRQGLSCDTTCSAKKLSCREDKLAAINNCAELQKYNICKGLCIASSGPDQPAEVVNGAPKHMHPGACLFNSQASQLSCRGYHPFTRRLCPCA